MIIYKTTNLINGKFYIGQDSKNDPTYIGSGKHFKRAIKKYGKENFKKEILEHCKTHEELDIRERHWIKVTNAIEEGYNFATGGQGGNLGPLVAEKKSESLKEYHRNNPDKVSGKNNPRYDDTIYEFYNIKTGELFIGTKYDLGQKLGINRSSPITNMILVQDNPFGEANGITHYRGWILAHNKDIITLESIKEFRTRNNPNWVSDIIKIEHPERNLVYEGELSGARLLYPEIRTNGLQKLINGIYHCHKGWILKNN